jgi:hypothetical protein
MKRDPLIQEFAEKLWAVHGPEALYEGLEEFRARVLSCIVPSIPGQVIYIFSSRHDPDAAIDTALKLQAHDKG